MNNKNIYTRVRGFIREHRLINEKERVLLSVSAGKDSMALLDVMRNLQSDLGIEMALFHLNHMMRGEESDADEDFVKNIAHKHGLEIFIYRIDFKDDKFQKGSFEEAARNKRYELLKKTGKEKGFNKIITAHNKDDNIETILMRIFRGTGVYGLTGISPVQGVIVRPILFLSAEEIYSHLKLNNIAWREDSSNKDNLYSRNYIRNDLLPLIHERFGSAGDSIFKLGEISREHISLLDDLINEKYGQLYFTENDNIIIDAEGIKDVRVFKYIISRVIRENLREYVYSGMLAEIYKKSRIDKTHIILYANSRITVKKTLYKDKKVIVISGSYDYTEAYGKWEYRAAFKEGITADYLLKEIDKEIYLTLVDFDFFEANRSKGRYLFAAIDNGIDAVTVRNRRNGDRIKLEAGSKKIKDVLIDYKLDSKIKEMIPLLLVNSDIAALMPSMVTDIANRVSVDYKVGCNSKKILAINWK